MAGYFQDKIESDKTSLNVIFEFQTRQNKSWLPGIITVSHKRVNITDCTTLYMTKVSSHHWWWYYCHLWWFLQRVHNKIFILRNDRKCLALAESIQMRKSLSPNFVFSWGIRISNSEISAPQLFGMTVYYFAYKIYAYLRSLALSFFVCGVLVYVLIIVYDKKEEMDLESSLFNIQVPLNIWYTLYNLHMKEFLAYTLLRIILMSTVKLIWLQLTIFLLISLKIFMAKEIQQLSILIYADLPRLGAINLLESPNNLSPILTQIFSHKK